MATTLEVFHHALQLALRGFQKRRHQAPCFHGSKCMKHAMESVAFCSSLSGTFGTLAANGHTRMLKHWFLCAMVHLRPKLSCWLKNTTLCNSMLWFCQKAFKHASHWFLTNVNPPRKETSLEHLTNKKPTHKTRYILEAVGSRRSFQASSSAQASGGAASLRA
eukprot:3086490-Amphidinium_carterae.1